MSENSSNRERSENIRRKYLISCHLVQCDVASGEGGRGGGGRTLFMSCSVSSFSQFPKGRLSNVFLRRHPNLIILIFQSVRVTFSKSHGNFFSALWDWLFFFSFRYPYTSYPLVSYRHVYLYICLFNQKNR